MKKNCLIIGASGDIGIAVAKRLVAEGYSVLLHYHNNLQAIQSLVQEFPDENILGIIHGDLSNDNGIKRFLDKLNFPIGNVIFTSGKSEYNLFQHTSEKTMDEMITLHVKAPWMITKHIIPNLVQESFGKIILITSIWGEVGASCEVIYSSVKGAQNSFVKALAKELAPNGISVNAVSPGFIETKMNNIFSNKEKIDIINEIPMNRAGHPDEVAHVVSFLLDNRSSYVQGEIINVTGSW